MNTRGSEEDKKLAAFQTAVQYLEMNGVEVTGTSGYTAAVAIGGDTGEVALSFADGCKRLEVGVDITTDFSSLEPIQDYTPLRLLEAYLDMGSSLRALRPKKSLL